MKKVYNKVRDFIWDSFFVWHDLYCSKIETLDFYRYRFVVDSIKTKNEYYHFNTKVAEFDFDKNILFVLDTKYLRYLHHTKLFINNLIYYYKRAKYGISPSPRYLGIHSDVIIPDLEIKKIEPEFKFLSDYLFNITNGSIRDYISGNYRKMKSGFVFLPQFPNRDILSPIRPNYKLLTSCYDGRIAKIQFENEKAFSKQIKRFTVKSFSGTETELKTKQLRAIKSGLVLLTLAKGGYAVCDWNNSNLLLIGKSYEKTKKALIYLGDHIDFTKIKNIKGQYCDLEGNLLSIDIIIFIKQIIQEAKEML